MLNALSRNCIHHVSFEFLRTEIGKGLWESFCEARAEHNDELQKFRVSYHSKATTTRFFACKAFLNAPIDRSIYVLQYLSYLPTHIREVVMVLSCVVESRLYVEGSALGLSRRT